jgi:hypothetical protein
LLDDARWTAMGAAPDAPDAAAGAGARCAAPPELPAPEAITI